MHKPQQQVRDWHQAIGDDFPAPGTTPIDVTRNAKLRLNLLTEELTELANALGYDFASGFSEESGDIEWTPQGPYGRKKPDTVGVIDALADIQFVLSGACDTWSIDLEPFFDDVVRSNLTKVGGPVRADGKRLKPDTYDPPHLAELICPTHGCANNPAFPRCQDNHPT